MLAKWFHIDISESDGKTIAEMQKDSSEAFRKIYNNLDLMHDKQFIAEIRERHKLSSKHYEYTASEAKNLYDRHQAGIKYNEEQIEVFREQMSEESSWKEKKKLNKKIINLQRANRREVVFGGRYLLKMICKHPGEAKYKDEFKDK